VYWSDGLPIAQHANTTAISDQYAYATVTAVIAVAAAVELTIKPAFSAIRGTTCAA
jgi:hypothetical protein